MKLLISFFLLALFGQVRGQDQPIAIHDFKNQHVIYADLGISPAPFNLSHSFPYEVNKLKYKKNFKPILGLAYAYKWFSMRIAFPVLPGVRSTEKFGKSKQFCLGFDYTFKRLYTDLDFRIIKGYAIKDAYTFDASLTENTPNNILPELGSLNLALNLWYFNHDDFKMNALQGRRAHFEKQVHTWYLKWTLNYFGVTNAKGEIIPSLLQDESQSKTSAQVYSALDFGIIPGYAYANRINNWQISGWAGLGPVIQSKFYTLETGVKGFLGLAPRYDIRLVGGYSNNQRFFLLATNFDNKSIAFNKLTYKQYFYTIRLVAGIRIPPKTPNPSIGRQRN
jgi:hypothetical protein